MRNWALKLLSVMFMTLSLQTIAPAASSNVGDSHGLRADRLVVKKAERRLYVFSNGAIIAVYPIALGRNPVGPKVFVGDGRTPEGRYVIESRNEKSDFYRALKISYPNEENKAIAREYGIPPGGQIMIHGQPNMNRPDLDTNSDWTEGCIAVTNRQMDELWRTVKTGTPINILP